MISTPLSWNLLLCSGHKIGRSLILIAACMLASGGRAPAGCAASARAEDRVAGKAAIYRAPPPMNRAPPAIDPQWRSPWQASADVPPAPRLVGRPVALPVAPGAFWHAARAEPQSTARRRAGEPVNLSPDGRWSLEQLTALALDNNPILRRAQARIEEARGAALQAGLWANPRWDTNNPYVLGAGAQQEAYNAGFVLDIPAMGKKRLDRAAAEQQVREAIFSAWSDRYDVLQAVREQFYSLLIQQQRVAGLERVLQAATAARDAAQRLYNNDQVAETDVLTLALEMQRIEAELLGARNLLISRRRQLAAAVGLPGMPVREALGDVEGAPPAFDDLFVRQYVAAQNVDVLSALAERRRTDILLNRARVEPYPNPYMGPAAQWGPNNANQQFWWNVQFNIPVWNLNQGGIASARWDNRAAAADVRVKQNQLLSQAADVLGRHKAARMLAERFRGEIVPVAQRNYELVSRGYPNLIPIFQLLEAQRSLYQARLDYLDALDDVWSTAAQLGNLLQLEQFP